MLVCNVSLLARRAVIAAGITEAAAALDSPGTGNVVFATLVDDPASVRDTVDAYTGEIMREAASASATVNAGLAYATSVAEAVTATDVISAFAPTILSAAIAEAVSAADIPDGLRIPAADPNFASVKLLMGFEGANGATSGAGFTDESSAAHGAGSRSGSIQISTAQFKFGSSSIFLGGAGGIGFADSTDWTLANNPFTIECWIYPTSLTGNQFIVCQWQAAPTLGWALSMNGAAVNWNVSTTGSNNLTELAGGTVPVNTWSAVCVEWDGIKQRLYLNGSMVASSTNSRTIFDTGQIFRIGTNSNNTAFWFSGYIDELRFTKGVARYASDAGYTVATTAFPRS